MTVANWLMIGLSSAAWGLAAAVSLHFAMPLWDWLSSKQMGRLGERFKRLQTRHSDLRGWLRIWGLVFLTSVGVLALGFGSYPLAVLAGLLVYFAPRQILDFLIRRRERLLRDQLISATVSMSNGIQAGMSLPECIQLAAVDAPAPLGAELRRIANEYHLGRTLTDSLAHVRRRLDLEAFSLFSLALETSIVRGGRINEALDRISLSLVEHQRLERKLASETAAGWQVVFLLSTFPVVFLTVMLVIDMDSALYLFETPLGQVVLASVGLLVYVGIRWAVRIMNIEI